jgi:hypothetical protein
MPCKLVPWLLKTGMVLVDYALPSVCFPPLPPPSVSFPGHPLLPPWLKELLRSPFTLSLSNGTMMHHVARARAVCGARPSSVAHSGLSSCPLHHRTTARRLIRRKFPPASLTSHRSFIRTTRLASASFLFYMPCSHLICPLCGST